LTSALTESRAAMTKENTPKIFPLSAITDRIQQILAPVSVKTFWVKAEISTGRLAGGSFFCDLIEANDAGKLIAKMRCNIWFQDLTRIQNKFRDQGVDLQLDNGTSAIFCCQLQFSPQYGISLKVIDADPSFVLGELEKRRQEILEGLKRDGLLDINKQLPAPSVPLKIGLVTSGGSAAFSDFRQTLSRRGYNFKIFLADSVVQGALTEDSVLKAFERLSLFDCDIVVLIRGGGSKTDLSYLDSDRIARCIAHYPFPVWTGIGHEIDVSVLDHVAHQSFKTPTAVAEELVARCVQADRYLAESAERLKTVWTYRLAQNREWLGRAVTGVQNGVRKSLDIARSELRELALTPFIKISGRLSREGASLNESAFRLRQHILDRVREGRVELREKARCLRTGCAQAVELANHRMSMLRQSLQMGRILRLIHNEQDRLSSKLSTIQANDPVRILQRGFALVKDTTGRIVMNTAETEPGQRLEVTMRDGRLGVEIKNIQKTKESKDDG